MKNSVIILIPIFVAATGVIWGAFELLLRLMFPKAMRRREPAAERRKRQLILLFLAMGLALQLTVWISDTLRYRKSVDILFSTSSQDVTAFRVYHEGSTMPVGTPVEFAPSDPIVGAFLSSLTDLRSCNPRGSTDPEHRWSVELIVGKDLFHMSFSIPTEILGYVSIKKGGDIVWGKFYPPGGNRFYGAFQSKALLKWYREYSHHWLEESPSPQEDR